jgi:hypothetical protein
MLGKSLGASLVIAGALAAACGSVAGSDPAFWQPAQGIAGNQYQFIPGQSGAAGSAAPPPNGAGGNAFPGAGGAQGFGGTPQFGGTPNYGGQPGTGNTPSYGGAPPPGTGGDIGGGGFFGTGGAPTFGTGGTPQPPPTTTGGPPPPPGSKCTFTFNVTTTSYGGTYRPNNVGAIYIETSSGGYVKSLNVWGGIRLGNLTDWETLSGGDKTDAVTSATRPNAGPISGNWDCTDHTHAIVPAGQYKACCSFQESDAFPFFGPAPKQACVDFSVGSGPQNLSPPDQGNFTAMHLSLQ